MQLWLRQEAVGVEGNMRRRILGKTASDLSQDFGGIERIFECRVNQ